VKRHAVALAFLSFGCTEHPPLDVAKVELSRFQGGWYEIAKIPRATQTDCTGTVAFYRLTSETELDFYSECHEKTLDGPVRRMAARAIVDDQDEPAKLSLDFGGYFGDYWIVERDADYAWAAVGHPSRDYLWILSRNAAMNEADFADVTERVRAKGFDVGRLERTLQAPEGEAPALSEKTIPAPTDRGCSVAPVAEGSRMRGVFAAVALGVLGIVWMLRRRSS
jgi:apolipoprotein D and lipocalin family protein